MDYTLCITPMAAVSDRLLEFREQGENDYTIAKRFGLSNVQVGAVFKGGLYFSPTVIKRVLGQDWGVVRLYFPVTPNNGAGNVPPIIVTHSPPRQCPVTDTWFIPTQPTQKYLPGLSAAVKRAARRDMDAARRKFGERGDWGKGS